MVDAADISPVEFKSLNLSGEACIVKFEKLISSPDLSDEQT